MKLLLTSTGITNQTIQDKFLEMVGKQPKDISLAYIPTAINTHPSPNKDWAIDNIVRLNKMGIGAIDIVDFSAIPREMWLSRLKNADALFVEGGMPFYLMDKMKETGLDQLLTTRLKDKVYVGCSAGSNVLGKVIIKSAKDVPEGYKLQDGLSIVNFSIRPHFFRSDRSQFTREMIAEFAKKYGSVFYAIDDDTAIAVEDGQVTVISEGKWEKFEENS